MISQKRLRQAIHTLAIRLPYSTIEVISQRLVSEPNQFWSAYQSAILRGIPQSHIREDIKSFFDLWQSDYSSVQPESISMTLIALAEMLKEQRKTEQIELVWTGYNRQNPKLRSSQEVLIELINSAEDELYLYAIFRFEPIVQALQQATERGVNITMILEMLNNTDQTTVISQVKRFDINLAESVTLYVWADKERPHSESGSPASMHAKIAIADEHSTLISSANLTGHALTINLEAGVFIKGGDKPIILLQEIKHLITDRVFIRAVK